MKGYAAVMTALAANSLTLLGGVLLTKADVVGVVFMGLVVAGLAVAAFWITADIIEAARKADDRERAARKERSRRRKGVKVIDLAEWPMIDEMGRIV